MLLPGRNSHFPDVDSSVDTSKGAWGVYVQSIAHSQDGKHVFMTLILERNVDDEHIETRKLTLQVESEGLENVSGVDTVLNGIRRWIETTEGDGSTSVDLHEPGAEVN